MARLARHIETGAHRGHLDQPEWRVAVRRVSGMLPVYFVRDVPGLYPQTRTPLPPLFSQVFILKVVKAGLYT